jgi:hypothetical protein
MLSNRLAVAALVVACIAAAGGGGYLATRQNAVPTPASASTQAATPGPAPASAAPAATSAERPAEAVEETEAVVGDVKPKSAPTATTTPAARPGRDAVAPRTAETPRVNAAAKAAAQTARQTTPRLARTWPSTASAQTPAPSTIGPAANANPTPEAAAPRVDDHAVQEPIRAPEPPQRTYDELVVSADSVIGLQTETSVSSEQARVEDRVDARVTRDVRVRDRVAIPAGARAMGTVTVVERGGKFKEVARLGVRFHTLVLADGTRLPISTETIWRVGDTPNSPAKVGGAAVGGAILGAILGGGKGAVLGGMAGAGAGSAVVMAGDRNAAALPSGSTLTVRILSPVTVTLENKEDNK